jgi:hypothetical protein
MHNTFLYIYIYIFWGNSSTKKDDQNNNWDSLLRFVVDNMNQYYFVSDIHNRNTRQALNLNLYQPTHHYIKKAYIILASNYSINCH